MSLCKKDKIKVDLLTHIRVPTSDLIFNTKYKQSLHGTSRKQNLTEGLTNITDKAFEFFLQAEKNRSLLMTETNVTKYGPDILNVVASSVKGDLLFEALWWNKLFQDFTGLEGNIDIGTCISELFEEVTTLYLKVQDNQFRKSYLAKLGKKKTMEHRKKVLQKKEKDEASSVFTLAKITTLPDSGERTSSHLKLKEDITKNKTYLSRFTKDNLLEIAVAYGLKMSKSFKKDKMVLLLSDYILTTKDTSHVKAPSVGEQRDVTIEGPSTSTVIPVVTPPEKRKASKKRTALSKKKKQVSVESCPLCHDEWTAKDPIPWLECSQCKKWWHRTCADLNDDEE